MKQRKQTKLRTIKKENNNKSTCEHTRLCSPQSEHFNFQLDRLVSQELKSVHNIQHKYSDIFTDGIGSNHVTKKDWLISVCKKYLYKPKIKETTFLQEIKAYIGINTHPRFKEIKFFLPQYLGVKTINGAEFMALENILPLSVPTLSSEPQNIIVESEASFRSVLDIKIGHSTYDPFSPVFSRKKSFSAESGWRLVGYQKNRDVVKMKKKDYSYGKDVLCLINALTIDQENAKTRLEILGLLKVRCEKLLEVFEEEECIDLISSSLLVYVERSGNGDCNVRVNIIDLAHSYFFPLENHKNSPNIFYNGLKGFIKSIDEMRNIQ